jgi:FlaA1/EpsC-like NDP-sugar epimerase
MWVFQDATDRVQVTFLLWQLRRGRPRPGVTVRDIWSELTRFRRRPAWRRAVVYAQFIVFDACVVAGAFIFAIALRFGLHVPAQYAERLPMVLVGVSCVYVASNMVHHMYLRGWRYAGLHDGLAFARAGLVSLGVVLVADLTIVPDTQLLPLSVVMLGGILALLSMGAARFRRRFIAELIGERGIAPPLRTLVVGAGDAGQRIAHDLLNAPGLGYRPVCFVDDDPDKRFQRIHGLLVAGSLHDIASLVQRRKIDVTVFAIPSLSGARRAEVLARCVEAGLPVKVMPSLDEILSARAHNILLRDAHLEDLLGRPAVSFADLAGRQHALENGSVLVTGAAGSIGSELARQVAGLGTDKLVLLDVNESGLFDLAQELESGGSSARRPISLVVADVTRERRLQEIFARYQPKTVFHVAAYKHVPLMEANPTEAVITNVLGTWNVCQAAAAAGAERVVFISTDKAVDPSSVMGATKRFGEHVIRAFAQHSPTIFCAVRFGNVLGSRGSVVPIFTRQIREGGPVTITHRDATRFFMTIPEAASLILEASCDATGGEIFLLDMGERVRVIDIARKMIQLHGLRPERDIAIEEIGLRAGEKMHEVLTASLEQLAPTGHPRVSCVRPSDRVLPMSYVTRAVHELTVLAERGPKDRLVERLFILMAPDSQAPSRPREPAMVGAV